MYYLNFFSMSLFIYSCFANERGSGSRVAQVVKVRLLSPLKTSDPPLVAQSPPGDWGISGM